MKRTAREGFVIGLVAVSIASGLGPMQEAVAIAIHRVTEPAPVEPAQAHPALTKLGRGASNVLGGWLEIPWQMHRHYAKGDVGTSMLTGAVAGLVQAVRRTAVGLYEVVTFPVPLPAGYRAILPTLEYFRKDTDREPLPLE